MPSNVLSLVTTLALASLITGCQRSQPEEQVTWPPAVSTSDVAGTTIVPTLDTPLASRSNAIWCATFQMAWNRACEDVIGGPIQLSGAEEVASRLNNSPVTDAVLPPGSYYAAAGTTKDGIVATIQAEMTSKFPDMEPPAFEAVDEIDDVNVLVAYAYLNTQSKFTTPFEARKYPIKFTDAGGTSHSVEGFGPHMGSDWEVTRKQLSQVKVLFAEKPRDSKTGDLDAFALDLTSDQLDAEVVVAVLPHADSLQAALDDLHQRIDAYGGKASVGHDDTLAIPNVVFNLMHDFTELEGRDKQIENPGDFQGGHIAKAWQSIRFRLDKSGAVVVSEAELVAEAAAAMVDYSNYVVDRPFLVMMKRREANEPFFVAWIDDAKLLEIGVRSD